MKKKNLVNVGIMSRDILPVIGYRLLSEGKGEVAKTYVLSVALVPVEWTQCTTAGVDVGT